MSKGSRDRVTDKKKFDENYNGIDWSVKCDREVWRDLQANMVRRWCHEPWPDLELTREGR